MRIKPYNAAETIVEHSFLGSQMAMGQLSEVEDLLRQVIAGKFSLRLPEREASHPLYALSLLINQLLDLYQNRIENKFFEQRAIFERVLDNAPIEVVIFDREGKYLYVNATGIKDPEIRQWIIGKTDRDWALYRNRPLEIVEARQKILDEVIQKKEMSTFHQSHTQADGSSRHYFRRMVPVMSSDEQVDFVFGFGLDITELKEKENQLVRTNEELNKINFELDQFVYRASHDMRAPLMTITGMSNLAEQTPESAPKYLSLIRQSVEHLDSLLGNIVDYSKNSRLKLTPERIDIQREAENLLTELVFQEDAVQIESKVDLSGNVPFASDTFRFRKLLRNLLSNAIRYRDPEKSRPSVEVNFICDEKQLITRIKDNGKGIDKEFQERLFHIFFRGTSIGRGSGLGLFIAKEIVDRLNGKLSFKSTPGVGTEFEVILPNLS